MTKFDYAKYCIKELFKKVPEINNVKGILKENLTWHLEEELASCIFEDVVCPYFMNLIQKNNKKDESTVNRIVNLIEELVNHKNSSVKSVAEVGFIEALLAKLKPVKNIEKYLLPKSLEIAKEIGWDSFGLDYRIGWKKAKEWYYPYSKYFGMISNKPEAKDRRLKEIYSQLYSSEDPIPGGIAFILSKQVKQNKNLTLLPKAMLLFDAIASRIQDSRNPLSESDLETAKVVMYNLRDSIKLAKDTKKN